MRKHSEGVSVELEDRAGTRELSRMVSRFRCITILLSAS